MKYATLLLLMTGMAWGQDTLTVISPSSCAVFVVISDSLAMCLPSAPILQSELPDAIQEEPDGLGYACGAYGCGGLYMIVHPPSNVRIDVPAIQETSKECVLNTNYVCSALAGSACPCGHYEDVPHPTCADKSRILLTSEDGQHHCVKFGVLGD